MPRFMIKKCSVPRGTVLSVAGALLGMATACGTGLSPDAAPNPPSVAASSSALPLSVPSLSPVPMAASTPPAPARTSSPTAPLAGAAPAPTRGSATGKPTETEGPDGDSPGRHDGSNYDNLSPEGKEAHDTENCAQIPGKKKGSCNEPHRKCREAGATATSSNGLALTCRSSPKDGRLRWLAAGE
ncbi:hypothetical protein ACIQWA_06510 [Kitasatospora sp. NPDC098652]|uniref:hypothetical protein n=1 Tax=Kitasatospora sp. NPDC098652 TaxID=3364095 RepID=UPI0037F4CABA